MAGAVGELERGRESYAKRAWSDAYGSLRQADQVRPLCAEDLELFARSAYMLGRDDDYVNGLERAHHMYLETGEARQAVRCAWWIGHNLLFRGEAGPARGWFARARRLLEREQGDCVERGYVLIASLLEHLFAGDHGSAHATAVEIAEIGERFGDRDLAAIGLMEAGHALVRLGRTEDGLCLVDETMVAVTTGELSPIVAGIVYCNTIAFCQSTFELGRAREWTAALTRWCDHQPDMVAHNGLCLVHRAQLMTLAGTWDDALDELHRLGERFTEGVLNQRALGLAAYQRGEVHRLRGEIEAAEAAYSEASRIGREPLPGLALLRLAQGKRHAAAAAIRRAVSETTQPLKRAALLPAYVDIMVAVGDVEGRAARAASSMRSPSAKAPACWTRWPLRREGRWRWQRGMHKPPWPRYAGHARLGRNSTAPHETAQARVLLGLTCRLLGDEDTAALDIEAARGVFTALRAAPALAWIDSLVLGDHPDNHGLTARELEVLRLVAAGKSNREIASALVITERTVARHLQNIFAKLRVSSRTAATKFAFEHELV